MNHNKQNDCHHDDLQIDFDVLGHVSPLHSLQQPRQPKQLEKTKSLNDAVKRRSIRDLE